MAPSVSLRVLTWLSTRPQEASTPYLTWEDIDFGLRQHCTQSEYTDQTFVEIAKLLEHIDRINGHASTWKRLPRTFTILYMIDGVRWMPHFVENHTDFDLPYNYHTWPIGVQDRTLQDEFLECQDKVLTPAYDLEKRRTHQNLSTSADACFKSVKLLGKGGYGRVDLVYSNLSGLHYARKLISRGKATAQKGQHAAIVKELEMIKQLSHRHVVRYIGSYTDRDYVAYLMEPIAKCDLHRYLTRSNPTDEAIRMNIQDFYGCLAGAINYVHKQHIRHSDITSRNILVKDSRIYLSDFGAARDFSLTGKSTTQHNVPFNINYVAPEVVRQEPRNTKSDMWSLGVVFLEITTVLQGRRLDQFWKHMADNATNKSFPRSVQANLPAANSWLDKIRSRLSGDAEVNEPIAWVKSLLEENQANRPSSKQLMSHIHSTPSFQRFCCLQCQDDYNKGDYGYEYESDHLEFRPRKERSGTDQLQANAAAMLEDRVTAPEPMGEEKMAGIKAWMSSIGGAPEHAENPSAFQSGSIYASKLMASPSQHGSECFFSSKSSLSRDSIYETSSMETDDFKTVSLNQGRTEDSGRGYAIRVDADSSDEDDEQQKASIPDNSYKIISESSDSGNSYSGSDHHDGFERYIRENNPMGFVTKDSASSDTESVVRDGSGLEILGEISSGDESASEPAQSSLRSPDHISESVQTPNNEYSELCEPLSQMGAAEQHSAALDGDQHSQKNIQDQPYSQPQQGPDAGSTFDTTGMTALVPPPTEDVTKGSFKPRNANITAPPAENGMGDTQYAASALDSGIEPLESKAVPMDIIVQPPGPSEQSLSVVGKNEGEIPKGRKKDKKGKKVTFERLTPKRKESKGSESQGPKVDSSKSEQKKPGAFVRRRPERKSPPSLFPEEFMNETRNKSKTPGSIASSTLSASSQEQLKKMNLNPWLDRTYHLLEGFCRQGKHAAVKQLLTAGSDPGRRGKRRPYPLIYSVLGASQRHNKCVASLLKHDADPKVIDRKRYGKTLLHLAIENNFEEKSGYTNLVNMLVFAGVNPNARDDNGEYTIQKIFKGPDTSGLADHRLEALALLLQSSSNGGTKVNIQVSGTLDTPLHLAVYRRSAMAVAMLLNKGADVNVVNSYGSTPLLSTALMWRAELQDSEQQILQLLSEREDIDLNVVSGANRRTALHHAVSAGAATAVEILLEKKANFRVKDADGNEPIDLLKDSRRRASQVDGEIRAMLLEAAGEPSPETGTSERI